MLSVDTQVHTHQHNSSLQNRVRAALLTETDNFLQHQPYSWHQGLDHAQNTYTNNNLFMQLNKCVTVRFFSPASHLYAQVQFIFHNYTVSLHRPYIVTVHMGRLDDCIWFTG